jgi:hypothetical protein
MTYETPLVKRPHHMAYVTLNRPDALNALKRCCDGSSCSFSPMRNMT